MYLAQPADLNTCPVLVQRTYLAQAADLNAGLVVLWRRLVLSRVDVRPFKVNVAAVGERTAAPVAGLQQYVRSTHEYIDATECKYKTMHIVIQRDTMNMSLKFNTCIKLTRKYMYKICIYCTLLYCTVPVRYSISFD